MTLAEVAAIARVGAQVSFEDSHGTVEAVTVVKLTDVALHVRSPRGERFHVELDDLRCVRRA